MSEVTGRLQLHADETPRPWRLYSREWKGACRNHDGESLLKDAVAWWWFARRIDAVAFAARKGIRLVTE